MSLVLGAAVICTTLSAQSASAVEPWIEPFRDHFEACWNTPDLDAEAMATRITIRFEIDATGKPYADRLSMISYENVDAAAAERVFDVARKAILRCGGQEGFSLLADQFEVWRHMELIFEPDRMGTS